MLSYLDAIHHIFVWAPTGPFMASAPIWHGEGWLPAIASHQPSEKRVSKKWFCFSDS
jgi:hypothetical protein